MYAGCTTICQYKMTMFAWGMIFLGGFCVTGGFSEAQEGDGESEPIPIATIEELQKIGNDPGYPLNGSYVLTQDIDASATATWNDGAGFDPIGKCCASDISFVGNLDGQGYVVSQLFINRPLENYVGLFGVIMGGHVWNLGIENSTVIGGDHVGGLVGEISAGDLTSCYTSTVVTGNNKVGGMTGNLYISSH